MAGMTRMSMRPGLPPLIALLSGSQEVPPVMSRGSGITRLGFDRAFRGLLVQLQVANLRRVTQAHIHLGRPGENGPVVLTLYRPASPVDVGAPTLLTNRIFTAANLEGPLAGRPLSALARQIAAGNAYVNVHTVAFPNGEIRGQIRQLR